MPEHSESHRRRVAMVGIDGFAPEWIERFLAEGAMPHLARIRQAGSTVPLVSTLPATTPVAWAAMATGCPPSSTGIDGFLLHLPGDAFDRRVSGAYASRCRREPIWETATLWGKRAYVVKFPLSYPSTAATLRVDGAAGWGGILCLHQACASGVADTHAVGSASRFKREDDARSSDIWRGRLEIPSLWGGDPVSLACAIPKAAPDTLEIGASPEATVRLRAGEWSAPVELVAGARGGARRCATRFKLLELDAGAAPGPRLRLFHAPVHELDGHSFPEPLARRHLARAGPIDEETEPDLLLDGSIDFDTYLERCAFNTRWLERLCASILDEPDWDLLMVHIHIVDWGHHLLHGAVDPRHPLHDPAQRPQAIERLRAHYRLADDLVGAVAARLAPSDNIVVLGDHGQDLHHTTVRLNEAFAERGWLVWATSDRDDVVWQETMVHAAGNYVYLNIAGRDPEGIVQRADVAALEATICAFLRALRDPRTGEAPILSVGPKRDFAAYGAAGAGSGDVLFCLASGYQARNDRGPVFALTVPGREFTSGHDHFHPHDPRIESRMYAAGPAFARGVRLPARSITDVNPTLCAVLGIEPTLECEGSAILPVLRATPEVDVQPEEAEPVACR